MRVITNLSMSCYEQITELLSLRWAHCVWDGDNDTVCVEVNVGVIIESYYGVVNLTLNGNDVATITRDDFKNIIID